MSPLRALPLLLAALLTTACGTAPSGSAPATSGESSYGAMAPGLRLGDVTAVRTVKPGELAVTVRVAAGEPGCATHVRVRDEGASGGYRRGAPVYRSSGALCPDTEERTVRWTVPARPGLLGFGTVAWRPGSGDVWETCSVVGCYPPADHCDDAWTSQVSSGVELPPEQRIDVLACNRRGLVVDVDAVVTGCQSVDGSTPPAGCAGEGVHARWYAVPDEHLGWRVVASGTAAGCADVLAVEPTFPRSLCGDLSAR